MLNTKLIRELYVPKRNLSGTTHWEGCEYSHLECAILKLCDEVDELRKKQVKNPTLVRVVKKGEKRLFIADAIKAEDLGNV